MTLQLATAKVRKSGVWVPAVGGAAAPWTRPSDWLALPTIGSGVQKFAGLFAVTNDDGNYVALLANGRGPIATSAVNAAGLLYASNDTITVPGIAGGAATITINTVDGVTGAVLTYTVSAPGLGFAPSSGVATTGGSGSGFTIDILTVTTGGGYHVDWGDGTNANVAAGVTAEHQYSYAGLDAGTTVTHAGMTYRQAIITVTPQGGHALTDLNLQTKHSAFSAKTTPPNALWLDVCASSSVLATYEACQVNGGTQVVCFPYLEKFALQENALTDAGYLVYTSGAVSLQRLGTVQIADLNSVVAVTVPVVNLYNAGAAGDVSVGNLPSAASVNAVVYVYGGGVGGNVSVGDMNAATAIYDVIDVNASIGGNASVGNANSALGVTEVIFVSGSIGGDASVGSMNSTTSAGGWITAYAVYGDVTLGATPLLTILDYFLAGLGTLTAWAFDDVSAVTSAITPFLGCPLRSLLMPGLQCDIDLSNCEMDASALAALFTSLGTVSGKTITVTGNYGASLLSGPQVAIATGKGWGVVQ